MGWMEVSFLYFILNYEIYKYILFYRNESYWIPGSVPNLENTPKLSILKKVELRTSTVYTLQLSGPDHMSLFIQPLNGSDLISWSFPLEPLEKKMGPPYFIYYSYALDNSPLNFTLEFEVI